MALCGSHCNSISQTQKSEVSCSRLDSQELSQDSAKEPARLQSLCCFHPSTLHLLHNNVKRAAPQITDFTCFPSFPAPDTRAGGDASHVHLGKAQTTFCTYLYKLLLPLAEVGSSRTPGGQSITSPQVES